MRKRYERPGPFGRPQKDRQPRRMLPGRALNPRIQRELRHANHLLSTGEHRRAAEIFADIAVKAHDLGIVYPAPMLHLLAAQALLLAGEQAASLVQARRGLELLSAQERWLLLHSQGQRYLQDRQQDAAAPEETQELQAWLAQQPTGGPAAAVQTCPYCGANASLNALVVRRGQASQCTYCASTLVLPDG